MKRKTALSFSLLVLLLCCSTGFAQGTAQPQDATKQTTPAAAADSEEKNIQQYIDLLRSNVRQQKSEIMGTVMQLDANAAAKFWPIYNEYDKELTSLNNLRTENIKEYARNYENLTDATADALIQRSLGYRRQRNELLANTYARVKASLGGLLAARFLQVENQLLELIDLQIESSLPIAPQSGSKKGK